MNTAPILPFDRPYQELSDLELHKALMDAQQALNAALLAIIDSDLEASEVADLRLCIIAIQEEQLQRSRAVVERKSA